MSRHRRVVVILALLCMVAAAPLAEAAGSGTYRCLAAVPDGGRAFFLHYNPNNIPQTVTRIRVWNSDGGIPADSGPIAWQVPANGALTVYSIDGTVDGFVPDRFQVVVNWSQAQDKAAPLPRVDMFPDGFASFVRTPCP